jgi:glycosyltransferase involved in cell wall biosynthesis
MNHISVLILTKNEQQDLPGCLQTFGWCDDVHVFDSCSTDETVRIATEFGATVTQRPFDSESVHKNWGLAHIAFKHAWVYQCDADERVTPELVAAMQSFVRAPGPHVAMRVQRRDYLMGTWLKHVTPSPFNIRLFKLGCVRYERLTNPVTLVDGSIAETDCHFDHYPFSKGMAHWFDKHNRYSTAEAAQIIGNRKADMPFSLRKAFTASDSNEKRYHQKELYYRLPLRPLLMFALLYLFKRGFLDGRAGLTFVVLRAIYEYMIVLKVRELEHASLSTPLNSDL